MKQRDFFNKGLIILGIMFILSSINSIYVINKKNKDYEAKGYKMTEAVCIEEKKYIKNYER